MLLLRVTASFVASSTSLGGRLVVRFFKPGANAGRTIVVELRHHSTEFVLVEADQGQVHAVVIQAMQFTSEQLIVSTGEFFNLLSASRKACFARLHEARVIRHQNTIRPNIARWKAKRLLSGCGA
jgi:hypothetical protein